MSDMEFIKSSKDAIEALSKIRWLAEHSDSCNTVEIDAVYDEALEFAINSLGAYKQVAWERDIAIEQLHELGYEFGQKIEPTTNNDLAVDAISRADARSLICNTDLKYHLFGMTRKVFKDLYNGIDELPPVTPQEPRWIPVSERLPEECTAVLVWCPERKNIYCAYLEEKQWWIFGAYWEKVTEEIAAWRPLPISPNSEVEE